MLPFPVHSAPTLGRFAANASRALVPLHVPWPCGRTSEPRRAAFHLALPSLCFHTLTNRFSRKPFVFTSIQIARGVMTPRFPRRIPSCNHAYGSTLLLPTACSLFGVLKKVKPRIFSHLQPLSTKHPGWGVPRPSDRQTVRCPEHASAIRNVDSARTSNYHCCKLKVPGPWMKPLN